jgi:hypothetical protein
VTQSDRISRKQASRQALVHPLFRPLTSSLLCWQHCRSQTRCVRLTYSSALRTHCQSLSSVVALAFERKKEETKLTSAILRKRLNG